MTYVVLLSQLLAERRAHDNAADARGGAEVRLSRLASGAGNACGSCHHVSILENLQLILIKQHQCNMELE